MLDIDTKRRIDTARDILVGKVPDPKSQVEQITIALIYKFMDDMDSQSEELGGKRKFFTGDFSRYGWSKLMSPALGGFEMLSLYAEGIAKMPENPGIPPLFRDIFKNAYLPYRDPETLKSFLKIIDEFTYDHSERLGDAFEYLLSVLGSQGDAGQFRTPRHIIDFIVEILDPKKTDTILDPACGTAGFLISSYKHILNANRDAAGSSTLTPDERGRLAQNFKGYDISPDMVRLSLVNMYLHGFTDPHIYEYDTLTSEERWNEFADVILANPPFMSPKGGIKPHKRFSIQAKRSEVLFVDYMAEHLTPAGRAGIIVPEGIIFQTQTAYRDLRKMLVENSLVAVISLPAGCFNPYSGVKTSILVLDKSLAKQTDSIAFFRVENDGYGLGAQRRAIERNDLPQVKSEIVSIFQSLKNHQPIAAIPPTLGLIVTKEKIGASDYNLSGERYREGVVSVSTWPFVAVSNVFSKSDETVLPDSLAGPVTYIGLENIAPNTGEIEGDIVASKPSDIKSLKCLFKAGDILYGKLRPNLNKVWLADRDGICSTDIFVIQCTPMVDAALYASIFRSSRFNDSVLSQLQGAQLPRIGWTSFAALKIPLPPLEIQQGFAAEIAIYRKVISGARAIVSNYRPQIPIHPDWPVHDLGQLLESKPKNGYSGNPVDRVTDLRVLTLSATTSGRMDLSKFKYIDEDLVADAPCRCRRGDIYLQRGNTKELVGTAAMFDAEDANYIYPDLMIRVRADESKIRSRYLLAVLKSPPVRDFLTRNAVGAAGSMPKINQAIVESIPIPLPSLATQEAIVAELEAEEKLISTNVEIIARFEKKTQSTLARIWGEAEIVAAES